MSPILRHLALLALTAAAIVASIAMGGGRSAGRPLRDLLWASVPVLVIGGVCSLLLLQGRKPVAEWLLPLAGVLLIGWRCRRGTVFRGARIIAPLVAAVLVLHFLFVAHAKGVTNAPQELERISMLHQQIALDAARQALKSGLDPNAVLPAGPIRTILPEVTLDAEQFLVGRARAEWHTWFTGLYRVERFRGRVWCPGGPAGQAIANLEVRFDPLPAPSE